MSGPHAHRSTILRARPHRHDWHLPDGTGLHARPGTITVDPSTGELICHICGGGFRALGAHIRTHGYTAESYRRALGLGSTAPLVSTAISAAIAERQRGAYVDVPEHRERLDIGHGMARDGRLAQLAKASVARRRPSTVARQRAALDAGRRTRATARRHALDDLLAAHGAVDLATYLRQAYADGASLDSLARSTGLGRASLRAALAAAGVDVRPPGSNTSDGKRARAASADRAAAARVGAVDIRVWLCARRSSGASVAELAHEVGRSIPWVRVRLTGADLAMDGRDRAGEPDQRSPGAM